MDVAGISTGGLDLTGSRILTIYYRNPPYYAVYRTAERVAVLFADDPERQQQQRTALSAIAPLRGEINGLVDSWRAGQVHDGIAPESGQGPAADAPGPALLDFRERGRRSREAAAARYDRRVADAVQLALEGDLPNASLYLESVKHDIEDDRNARARRIYVTVAGGAAALLVLVALGFSALRTWGILADDAQSLCLAAGAGALGAFFSVAIATRGRAPLTDFRLWDNSVDATLRVVIGVISALVLILLFRTGLVSSIAFGAEGGTNGARLTPGLGGYDWLLVAVVGFLAGFAERLVGDLLGTVALATRPAKVPGPAPDPDGGAKDDGNAKGGGGKGAVGAGGPPPAAPPAAPDGTPDDEHCLCDAPPDPAEVTPDDSLPPAAGGVAAPAN